MLWALPFGGELRTSKAPSGQRTFYKGKRTVESTFGDDNDHLDRENGEASDTSTLSQSNSGLFRAS